MHLGYVYFLQVGTTGVVKIGFSFDPHKRAKMIQTAHPEDVQLLGVIVGDTTDEKYLHGVFEHLHIKREWFEPGDDLLAFIREYATELPTPTPRKPRKKPNLGYANMFRARARLANKNLTEWRV